ncbi:MAG: hypothetical protein GF331_16455 [Chitinivibrionales bacterium]|nr:hypothetical protein [Chitinivibrionales bacterium]
MISLPMWYLAGASRLRCSCCYPTSSTQWSDVSSARRRRSATEARRQTRGTWHSTRRSACPTSWHTSSSV